MLRTDVPLAAVVEERHWTARLRLRKSLTRQLAGTRTHALYLRVSCRAVCPHLLQSQTQWAAWA